MSIPMTPGSKSETLEDVIDLAWNNEGIVPTKYKGQLISNAQL